MDRPTTEVYTLSLHDALPISFRPQAGRTHHLTPDELIRLVERGELCARLSDPERSEVYQELVTRLPGSGKRWNSPDRPDTYPNTLESPPGRNARGLRGLPGLPSL